MGAEQSTEEAGDPPGPATAEAALGHGQSQGTGHSGFHVLKVAQDSPGEAAGLQPFFDYLVGVNALRLDTPESGRALSSLLRRSLGSPVTLSVFNIKAQAVRQVIVVPSETWGPAGDAAAGLLGCHLRYCSFFRADEHVWRVIAVSVGSPAELAGLRPSIDYIIGTPSQTLKENEDFYDLVNRNVGSPLSLFVYSSETDGVREVVIVPNTWAGPGVFGCDIAYGGGSRQHRLPVRPVQSQAPPAAIRTPPRHPSPLRVKGPTPNGLIPLDEQSQGVSEEAADPVNENLEDANDGPPGEAVPLKASPPIPSSPRPKAEEDDKGSVGFTANQVDSQDENIDTRETVPIL